MSDAGRDPVGADPGRADDASPAAAFSWGLLDALVRAGVSDVVVSPGSRSQALALAAAALERADRVALHVRIDERSAGYFALGLARETGRPAAVVVTSGGAVANLHPAVLEAHASFVPMILLTADRPPELHGIRANQTADQAGLFGSAVRLMLDVEPPAAPGEDVAARAEAVAARAWEAAAGSRTADPGPVQVNVALREPLSGGSPWDRPTGPSALDAIGLLSPAAGADDTSESRPGDPSGVLGRGRVTLAGDARTVVIAGDGAGGAAEQLAHEGGWPLLAEVTSGARFGRELVVSYRELLADPVLGGRVQRAIVFGHPTLSREVPALLQRPDVEVVVVAPVGAEVYDPGRRARVARAVVLADPAPDRAWLGEWIVRDRELAALADTEAPPELTAVTARTYRDLNAHARAELAVLREPVDRRMLVRALWSASWPLDRLVLGASRLIRELDRVAPGKKIPVLSNRGLAGIDGTIATALGVAAASQRGGRPGATRVLLGDLALLHDIGSLLLDPAEDRPRVLLVVGNDGGGSIFDGLEVAATAPAELFDRVVYTPRRAELASLAAGFGWEHRLATTRGELDAALTAPVVGPSILEVPLARR